MRALLETLDVNRVLVAHAVVSIALGGLSFILPHGLMRWLFGGVYSHELHEVVRMYGALTLAQGWLTYQTRKAGDARVKRAMGEAYSISYGLQALALLRAHLTSPNSHSMSNLLLILLFCSVSGFYAWCRWHVGIKVFELDRALD
jgi:hypothetical protein